MNLEPQLEKDIVNLIKNWSGVQKIMLYGSRAENRSKKTSDVDLALMGPTLTDREVSLIRDALEEKIKTPLKFDVVHFDTLSKEALKQEILKEGHCLYDAKKD